MLIGIKEDELSHEGVHDAVLADVLDVRVGTKSLNGRFIEVASKAVDSAIPLVSNGSVFTGQTEGGLVDASFEGDNVTACGLTLILLNCMQTLRGSSKDRSEEDGESGECSSEAHFLSKGWEDEGKTSEETQVET